MIKNALMAVSLCWVLASSVHASRGLSDLPRFSQVTSEIFRSARPAGRGLEKLSRKGIRTIIDLEDSASVVNREEDEAREQGIRFLRHPLSMTKKPKRFQIDAILDALRDSRNLPVLIHCKAGRDRTGLLIGLYRVEVQGWDPRDAWNEMMSKGFRPSRYLGKVFQERTGYRR